MRRIIILIALLCAANLLIGCSAYNIGDIAIENKENIIEEGAIKQDLILDEEQMQEMTVSDKSDMDHIKETALPQDLEGQIVSKYVNRFAALRNEYNGKLYGLLEQAKKEYLDLSQKKGKKAQFGLALKYFKKGRALENECNKRFNKILSQMKVELKKNNLPTNSIKTAKNQYRAEKNKMRKYLVNKALNR